jgi:hypothetical protein
MGAALGQGGPYLPPSHPGGEARGWVYALSGALQPEALDRAPPAGDAGDRGPLRGRGSAPDARDPGPVAWVEETHVPGGAGWVDAQIWLHVAAGGERLRRWEVPTYNPYFGARVSHLAWHGEHLILCYREKHRQLLAVIPPAGEPTVVTVSDAHAVLDDAIWFVAPQEPLVEGLALPGLEPLTPLPLEHSALREDLAVAGGELLLARPDLVEPSPGLPPRAPPERLGLPLLPQGPFPADAEAFQAALVASLGVPRALGELLVGALAHRFWLDLHQRRPGYAARARWNSPRWVPAYWVQFLRREGRAEEAEAVLEHLDDLAAQAAPAAGWGPGWGPDEGALRLAREHVARRAAPLAAAARGGALPRRQHCHHFAPWSQEGFAADLARFPPGFRAAWEAMVAHPAGPPELRRVAL